MRIVRSALVSVPLVAAALVLSGFVTGCGEDEDSPNSPAGGTTGNGGATGDGGATDGSAGTGDAMGGQGGQGQVSGVSEEITPEDGGTITSEDGLLTLEFPPGAVSDPVTITVGVAADGEGIEGADTTYVLGPDGQQFDEPVVVTLKVPLETMQAMADDAELDIQVGPNAAVVVPLVVMSGGELEHAANQTIDMATDAENALLSGELSHFSAVGVIRAHLSVDGALGAVSSELGGTAEVGSTKAGRLIAVTLTNPGLEILTMDELTFETSPGILTAEAPSLGPPPVIRVVTNVTCHEEVDATDVLETVLVAVLWRDGFEEQFTLKLADSFTCTASSCMTGEPAPGVDPTVAENSADACAGDTGFVGGTGFNQNGTCVAFANTSQLVNASSDVFLNFLVAPDTEPGTYFITLNNGTGTTTSTFPFTVLAQGRPVIDDCSPLSGASGTTMTCTGSNLDQTMSIAFAPFYFPDITNQTATSFDVLMEGPPGDYVLNQMVNQDCAVQTEDDLGQTFTITP